MSHPRVKVLSQAGVVKERRGNGFASSPVGNNVFFYNNSFSVMHRALMERLYYVKQQNGGEEFVPCPLPTRSFDSLSHFKTMIKRLLPALPPVWTYEQFVESYSGPKKARYQCAADKLARTGCKRTYGYLKTFIKGEWYDGTSKSNPCPRLIQPRSPEYNVAIGCYLRPMEKLIYKAIDRLFGYHVVLKCDAPWERAKTIKGYWSEFVDPVFVGFDASRFDQHTSAAALEWEHSVYLSIHNDSYFSELLSWQVSNVGYASTSDGLIQYKVNGCRMSGDMNTALGNVLIMCGITHHFLQQLGVKTRFIDDGDDCGVFLERSDLHLLGSLPAHHLEFGYEMTVESPAYCLEHIEFCQSRPVNCGDGNWMMVRNIHKALKQDAMVIDKLDWAETTDVLAATGVCGLALYGGMPVLDEFYSMLARCSSRTDKIDRVLTHVKTGPQSWRSQAGRARLFTVDETVARVSVYKAFGLLPDYQVALEGEFRAQSLNISNKQSHAHNHSSLNKVSYYLQ